MVKSLGNATRLRWYWTGIVFGLLVLLAGFVFQRDQVALAGVLRSEGFNQHTPAPANHLGLVAFSAPNAVTGLNLEAGQVIGAHFTPGLLDAGGATEYWLYTTPQLAAQGLHALQAAHTPAKEIATIQRDIATYPHIHGLVAYAVARKHFWVPTSQSLPSVLPGHLIPTHLMAGAAVIHWFKASFHGVHTQKHGAYFYYAGPVAAGAHPIGWIVNVVYAPVGLRTPAGHTHVWGSMIQSIGVTLLAAALLVALLYLLLGRWVARPIRYQAEHDLLTGLYNQRMFWGVYRSIADQAFAQSQPLTVWMLDLDHFKSVNDRWGHHQGDEVLKAATERIAAAVRASDLVGRIGGEEFAIAAIGFTEAEAAGMAERIRQSVRTLTLPDGSPQTVSIGVAWTDRPIVPDDLLHRADEAAYAAKQQGRDRFIRWSQDLGGTTIHSGAVPVTGEVLA